MGSLLMVHLLKFYPSLIIAEVLRGLGGVSIKGGIRYEVNYLGGWLLVSKDSHFVASMVVYLSRGDVDCFSCCDLFEPDNGRLLDTIDGDTGDGAEVVEFGVDQLLQQLSLSGLLQVFTYFQIFNVH
jgi:hypothetical protein